MLGPYAEPVASEPLGHLAFAQIHARRPDEACHEGRLRPVVQFQQRAGVFDFGTG
jgi:hypothetical protein